MIGKRSRVYMTSKASKRYAQQFIQGGKERGLRGGVIYVLRKFPVLYHATIEEVQAALGVERLLTLVDRLAADETRRLDASADDLMVLQPTGAYALAAGKTLGMGDLVAALTPFGRVCLEVSALALVALDGRHPLMRARTDAGTKLEEIQCEGKDVDQVFFQRTFGQNNLTNAMSLVAEHFWTWFDLELAAVKATPDGARHLSLMTNKTTMQDSPLPGGDFTGEVLAHRLAVRVVETSDPERREKYEAVVAWYAGLPAFQRAVLELHLCVITPMKKLHGVNALLLPSTSSFYETYFGTPATGAAFACETFRAMFEAELATDFIRTTFTRDELAVLRKLLRQGGLPKGEEVGLHVLNLLKREVDLLRMTQAGPTTVCKSTELYEALIAKIVPLNLLQRMTLSMYLLVH